jgi:hypothetical protein
LLLHNIGVICAHADSARALATPSQVERNAGSLSAGQQRSSVSQSATPVAGAPAVLDAGAPAVLVAGAPAVLVAGALAPAVGVGARVPAVGG